MAHQAHHIKCPTQRTSSSHPSQPGNSFSSTPCSFPRVRSLSYSVIDNWYFHSFSLHFSLFPFTIFYYPKWMRPYIDYPSPIVYFPSALYTPVPSTSKQVVGLCRFYYFLFFLDLTNIFRTFHPKTAKDTVFLSAYETFSRIDHIPGHKSDLHTYKKMNTIPYTMHIFQPQWYET